MSPLGHKWDDSKLKNKSAYLSSVGLWTACRESREVVAKDWDKQPRPYNDYDIYYCCSREKANYYYDHFWPEDEGMSKTFMFCSKIEGEHWHQNVHLEQDLFCIVSDDWEFVAHNWESCANLSPGSIGCNNIAVEFDESWNLALENKMNVYPAEVPASLEFLLRLLFERVGDPSWNPMIKLIVRDKDWILLRPTDGFQIRDIDEEYLEVPADEVESSYHRDQERIDLVGDNSLFLFFDYLDQLFYDDLLDLYCEDNCTSPGYEESLRDGWFNIRDSFSILVPRSNQVEK
ncbi:hypothetical protein FPOAC2_09638 [Fusarium poae]|jgi:hypothetical protein|uniref:hypothetical protein n=1 Tax=Fusarium poae TaxID=36050 RepID=UPI001CE882F5|nr:hypothetical protein FPOAC1_009696 [Fusarium poae]KAG8670288.1 hypothetical protein FPOAC1_009696 [Fusarium poae]